MNLFRVHTSTLFAFIAVTALLSAGCSTPEGVQGDDLAGDDDAVVVEAASDVVESGLVYGINHSPQAEGAYSTSNYYYNSTYSALKANDNSSSTYWMGPQPNYCFYFAPWSTSTLPYDRVTFEGPRRVMQIDAIINATASTQQYTYVQYCPSHLNCDDGYDPDWVTVNQGWQSGSIYQFIGDVYANSVRIMFECSGVNLRPRVYELKAWGPPPDCQTICGPSTPSTRQCQIDDNNATCGTSGYAGFCTYANCSANGSTSYPFAASRFCTSQEADSNGQQLTCNQWTQTYWLSGQKNCDTNCNTSNFYIKECRSPDTGAATTCGNFGVYYNSCNSVCDPPGNTLPECSTSCTAPNGSASTCNQGYTCVTNSVQSFQYPYCNEYCNLSTPCETICKKPDNSVSTCGTFQPALGEGYICTAGCNYNNCESGTQNRESRICADYPSGRKTCLAWAGGADNNNDDKDLDRVPDALENQLAAAWFPTLKMTVYDARYFHGTTEAIWTAFLNSGPSFQALAHTQQTATLPFVVRPYIGGPCTEDLQCLEIHYILYFWKDPGDCMEFNCVGEHVGDSETHSVLLSRKWVNSSYQNWNTQWNLAKNDISAWRAVENFAGAHQCTAADSSMFSYAPNGFTSAPLIYTAVGKHGSYFTSDFCDGGGFQNSDNCNGVDVVPGLRTQAVSRLRNVGEQWAHSDSSFAGHRMAYGQKSNGTFYLATGNNAYDVWSGNASGYDWDAEWANADPMLYRFKRGYIDWNIPGWTSEQNMLIWRLSGITNNHPFGVDRFFKCNGE